MQPNNSSSSTWSNVDSSLDAPLLPQEHLQSLSSPHSSLLRQTRRLALDSDSNSDQSESSSSFPFPDMNLSDGSRSSSTDSNETIRMPLLPHQQLTSSPWASESSMGSPSSASMAKRIRIAKDSHRRHPLLLDLERMQHAQHASVLEPELQYEQGSWFPSSSSSGTTIVLPPDNQRYWGEFCASPEPITPVDDEVRRSLQPLFDMEIFRNESSDEGLGACVNNEAETDIISSLEEGYLPSATGTQILDEEAGTMKRSESLVSFKDLNIPPPKAPAPAPIASLKRRVSYACETATGMVKGSQVAAATSSFVGNLFDYLIEKGF
ncbi:hypothetical protein QBC32DRAFT_318940 [Pseudoneurospora amorphoporcata]|uniref:Uncharacterized protein n=1 Tax=Pseudoneurospora amorphoporcata TaxID=241081 RepID=A0AAN6SBZ4_9PEZI|nr:hypothetical protein QBC32DRAFT_318940 [Pseudoneurospora amorphoporcata]